jgi:hypothetical protein
MDRLDLIASWFFASLGTTLLVLAPLVAPEKVFGDTACYNNCIAQPSCASACANSNFGAPCYACRGACCAQCYDPTTDPTGSASCCETNVCAGITDKTAQANCMAGCEQAQQQQQVICVNGNMGATLCVAKTSDLGCTAQTYGKQCDTRYSVYQCLCKQKGNAPCNCVNP